MNEFQKASERGQLALQRVENLYQYGSEVEIQSDELARSIAVKSDIAKRRLLFPCLPVEIASTIPKKSETLRERRAHFWQ